MLKVAVADLLAFMVSVQLPVPVQAPDQPAKKAPEAGVGVNLTLVPELNDPLHVDGQLIPAGVLITAPRAVPASCMVSWYAVVSGALTACDWADAKPLAEKRPTTNAAVVLKIWRAVKIGLQRFLRRRANL
jgi:hypothetical protein